MEVDSPERYLRSEMEDASSSPGSNTGGGGGAPSSPDGDDDAAMDLDGDADGESDEENPPNGAGRDGARSPASSGGQAPSAARKDAAHATSPSSSLVAYQQAVRSRHSYLLSRPSQRPASDAQSYALDSLLVVPQSCQVHSLAVPAASGAGLGLYTGGGDGFIRRYGLYEMLNGTSVKGSDNFMALPSKAMPADEGVKVERQPVLLGYWENDDPGDWVDELLPSLEGPGAEGGAETKVQWGPKSGSYHSTSPVYSLAVQKEEVWGLSGTGQGTINLFTIRQDEGQIRHVFRSSNTVSKGHRATSPVSTILLAPDETSFLSGGWDGQLLEWDLNTGSVVRSFEGHDGQLSSLAWRPSSSFAPSVDPPPFTLPKTKVDEDLAFDSLRRKSGREGSPASSVDSEEGVAKALVAPLTSSSSVTPAPIPDPAPTVVPNATDVDGDFDAEGDIDADGEADADAEGEDDIIILPNPAPAVAVNGSVPNGVAAKPVTGQSSSSLVLPTITQKASRVPFWSVGDHETFCGDEKGGKEGDVFMSSSVDGRVMLWDRRVAARGGGVRQLGGGEGKWCASAAWLPDGHSILLGRRSASIEHHDLRFDSPSTSSASASSSSASSNPALEIYRLPAASGPVSAVVAMPNGRAFVSGSWDCLRIWDMGDGVASGEGTKRRRPKIVQGHQGGRISSLCLDPAGQFLISASGNRGWDGTSSEAIVLHDVRSIY